MPVDQQQGCYKPNQITTLRQKDIHFTVFIVRGGRVATERKWMGERKAEGHQQRDCKAGERMCKMDIFRNRDEIRESKKQRNSEREKKKNWHERMGK